MDWLVIRTKPTIICWLVLFLLQSASPTILSTVRVKIRSPKEIRIYDYSSNKYDLRHKWFYSDMDTTGQALNYFEPLNGRTLVQLKTADDFINGHAFNCFYNNVLKDNYHECSETVPYISFSWERVSSDSFKVAMICPTDITSGYLSAYSSDGFDVRTYELNCAQKDHIISGLNHKVSRFVIEAVPNFNASHSLFISHMASQFPGEDSNTTYPMPREIVQSNGQNVFIISVPTMIVCIITYIFFH